MSNENCCNCQLFDENCFRLVTGINFNFTAESLQSPIKLANDIDIKPILGDCYDSFCLAKTEGALTNAQKLLIAKLQDVFAWSVFYRRLDDTIVIEGSAMQTQLTTEVELAILSKRKKDAQSNMNFYLDAAKKFIKTND